MKSEFDLKLENAEKRLAERLEREKQKEADENRKLKLKQDVIDKQKAESMPVIMKDNKDTVEMKSARERIENVKEYTDKSSRIDRFKLSYIEDYEEDEAKRQIEEALGFEPIRVTWWQIAIKVYVRPEEVRRFKTDDGREIGIYIPDEARAHDKFVNNVGLIMNIGPLAFLAKPFQEPLPIQIWRYFFGRWMKPSPYKRPFKVGDWVVFDRNSGPEVNYRGVPVVLTEEKFVRAVIEDPSFVTRY